MKYLFRSFYVKITCFIVLACALIFLPQSRVMAYEDIVVVIDPGHGGVTSRDGSNDGAQYNGVSEKDVNLITATALYNELSQYQNVTVYMTRTTDVEMSLEQRVSFAKSVDANVLVSVHYNASDNHNYYGSEIFTSMYGQPRATGYGLATCIQKYWTDFGTVSRGVKTRAGQTGDYYGLIRQGCDLGMPVIILEHGYLDNSNDFDRMSSTVQWQQLGILDAKGIADYYGFRKDLVQATITPTVKVESSDQPALPDDTPPTSVKLVVDEYNEETGVIKYSLSASDDYDNLMYFGLMKGPVTGETVFHDLMLWDNNKGVQTGEFTVPAEYKGNLTARVYNTYELYTDSESIDLSLVNKQEEESEDASAADEDSEADSQSAESDDVPGDGESDEFQVLDTIIIGESQAGEHIDITPDMVEKAENAVSLGNRAKVGLAITGSLVILGLIIAIAIGIHSGLTDTKKSRKSGHRDMYDWEDRDDY